MLARAIHDDVESRRGTVPGLGLLPVEITFEQRKTVALVRGHGVRRARSAATRSTTARVSLDQTESPLITYADGRREGARHDNVAGTHWHGAFESDEFRRRFLTDAARHAGRHGFEVSPDTSFARARERTLDLLGDLVEEHLDTNALWQLVHESPSGTHS